MSSTAIICGFACGQPTHERDNRPRSFQVPPEPGDILFVLQRHSLSEDRKAFENLWTIVEWTRDGKPTTTEELRGLKVDVDPNTIGAFTDRGALPNSSVAGSTNVRAAQPIRDSLVPPITGSFVLDETTFPKRVTTYRCVASRQDNENGERLVQLGRAGVRYLSIRRRPPAHRLPRGPAAGEVRIVPRLQNHRPRDAKD